MSWTYQRAVAVNSVKYDKYYWICYLPNKQKIN